MDLKNVGQGELVEAIVKAENLSKIYGSGSSKVVALDSVNLEIKKGEIVAILGPSGSGKTTLLNLLAGLDIPTSGTIVIDGQEITKMSEEEKAKFRAKSMGFIFQFFNLIPVLTAVENAELPLLLNKVPVADARKRALELLELMGISHRKDAYPSQLSGGEQQRVSIARALATKPKIIWADEPTGALDVKNGEQIKKLIIELNREFGTTFVIVTHDQNVAQIANRIMRMENGRIVEVIENTTKGI
ncbi:putative ABC transport system ATP-binding protein [Fervidobacterium changbaicum]|uniref:ABC transporter ATP-binding protein n=2 Tax=Fervidobacterium TaxID=2422 RepID=A0AAI8GCE5_FERIS|nr:MULTISPECIES: ABC transporter ATP-binding protein [Fervidobacterium]AMW32113.1 ABC transporter ATP-binding protein [Fervidobacterium islandicum]QAV33885.1 ABC transporter ATP-binding protein [Fervidobacterium changbaicum]SDH73615.1 putative ABC transport system ATP-binding protein [Fervidobacterium changbaicum]